MSIRERIDDIGQQMLSGDPSPADARQHEAQLAGLLAHVNKAVTGAEVVYKRKLSAIRSESSKSAADARIQAEATQEYADWREALSYQSSVEELLKTLRNTSYSRNTEMKLAR